MRKYLIMCAVILAMFVSAVNTTPAFAIDVLTLEEALNMAAEKNLNYKNSQLDYKKAGLDLDAAWRNLWPKLNLQTSYIRLDEGPMIPDGMQFDPNMGIPVPTYKEGSPNVWSTQLSFQQPIFLGGKALLGIDMAKIGVTITEIQARQSLNDLFFQVIQSYYNLLLAKEMLNIQQGALKLLEEHGRIVQVNFQNGLALRTEVLKVEMEKSKTLQNLRSAENGIYLAKRHLGLLLGMKEPVGEVQQAEWELPVTLSLETLYSRAFTNRPELQLLTINQEMLKDSLKLEQRSYWPNVVLAGNYSWKDDHFTLEDGSWNLSVAASMSVFDGGVSFKKQQGLKVQLEKLQQNQENLQNLVQLEVEEAVLKADEARQALALQQQNLVNAEENLALVKASYEYGAGTSLEVLNARTLVEQAEVSLVQSQFQYQLGLFKVLYKTGQLADYCKEVIYGAQ